MSFFSPNLSRGGRFLRGAGSAVLGIAAALTWPHSTLAGIALAGSALFVGIEALRGWCVLRACGIRTRI